MSSYTEQIQYFLLESEKEYEIRLYPSYIVAQTLIQGSYQSALNQGFGILAGYIFGGNTKQESIAMTEPVIEQSANVTTTNKVLIVANNEGNLHTVTFGMPRSYTLKTLPAPTDSRVKIVIIPKRKMAAIKFSWFLSSDHISSKKQELIGALKRDNIGVLGNAQYAGYCAPWTPPWAARNEVMVEIAE
jgi:effector-binding domain-containing protein